MFDGTWGTKYTPREPEPHPWEEWFAWLPVEVHGKRKWLTRVWRKQIRVYGDAKMLAARYEYGNLFDVIRNEE